MAKQKTATQESSVKRDLRSPKYRMRVVKDKTKYDRKRVKRSGMESYQKAA